MGECSEGKLLSFSTIQTQNDRNRKWFFTASPCSKGRRKQTEQAGKIYESTFQQSSQGEKKSNSADVKT